MTFEFLIVYQSEVGVEIRAVLLQCLREVLTENLNEFDAETTERMLLLRFERRGQPITDESGVSRRRTVLSFSIELPDETDGVRAVVDEFADSLFETPPIEHVMKFEDPLLEQELQVRSQGIFALEMKLRRVLSLIYLNSYQDRPYNLLRDELIKPMHPPQEPQMRAAVENEFFFLTFDQYISLNRRPDFKNVPALVELIRSNTTYDALRHELDRLPVEDADGAGFLAGIRAHMKSIEDMRNCVAHNRRPSRRIIEDYENACPELERMLDDFLIRWLTTGETGQLPWDIAAREAVDRALANAEWDEDKRVIRIPAEDEHEAVATFSGRRALVEYLRDIACTAFFSRTPRDADPPWWTDGQDVVDEALEPLEDRLLSFFTEKST